MWFLLGEAIYVVNTERKSDTLSIFIVHYFLHYWKEG